MASPDLVLAMRDWMLYRNANHMYKVTMSKTINTWTDERKLLIKPLLKHLNKQTTVKAWDEVTTIYKGLIKPITDATTADGTYTDWVVLKSDTRSCLYTAVLNGQPVIVKTYVILDEQFYHYGRKEDTVTQALYEQGFNVPVRYQSFTTDHQLCIPMQKLDTTLLEMYQKNPCGIGIEKVKRMVKCFVPILHILHTVHKHCYVDFSCGNVGFYHNEPYMIDFGALCPTFCSPCMKTDRYASINAMQGKVTYVDDLQSLGFVITEALCGPCYELDKTTTIEKALTGQIGEFLQAYFKALESDDPYTALLALTQ